MVEMLSYRLLRGMEYIGRERERESRCSAVRNLREATSLTPYSIGRHSTAYKSPTEAVQSKITKKSMRGGCSAVRNF